MPPENTYDNPVNSETSRKVLERGILEAARSSDTNVVRFASEAKAEIERREREQKAVDQEVEQRNRLHAQKFQSGLVDKQLEASENQLRITRFAMIAAIASAIAISTLAVVNVVRFFSDHQPPG